MDRNLIVSTFPASQLSFILIVYPTREGCIINLLAKYNFIWINTNNFKYYFDKLM